VTVEFCSAWPVPPREQRPLPSPGAVFLGWGAVLSSVTAGNTEGFMKLPGGVHDAVSLVPFFGRPVAPPHEHCVNSVLRGTLNVVNAIADHNHVVRREAFVTQARESIFDNFVFLATTFIIRRATNDIEVARKQKVSKHDGG
jgi:hypothetical protein